MEESNYFVSLIFFAGSWTATYFALKELIFKKYYKKYDEKIFLILVPFGLILLGLIGGAKEKRNQEFARDTAIAGFTGLIGGFCHCAYKTRHRGSMYNPTELHPVEKEIHREMEIGNLTKIFTNHKERLMKLTDMFRKIDSAKLKGYKKNRLEDVVTVEVDKLLDDYNAKKKKQEGGGLSVSFFSKTKTN